MTTKKEIKHTNELSDWFFKKPLKFALESVGYITGILLFFFALNTLFFNVSAAVIRLPMFITVGFTMIYMVCKLIKWLPKEPMDRHSFIGIDNGLTIIYYVTVVFSTVLLAKNYSNLIYITQWLTNYSVVLFVLGAMIGVLLYLYTLGLIISNIYVTYKRAMFMGVPKWKAILSFPFASTMIWLPGYILPEHKKVKKVLDSKVKWFSELTDWIISKQIHAVMMFGIAIVFSYLFLDMFSTGITIVFGIIFGIWVSLVGKTHFVKSMGGMYTTLSAVINIILVTLFLSQSIFPAIRLTVRSADRERGKVMQTQTPITQPDQIKTPKVQKTINRI